MTTETTWEPNVVHTGPPALDLPSAGPDPIPFDTAVAAALGYARGRRPLRFRPPSHPQGLWIRVPAFGYERYDRQPVGSGDAGDGDVLIAEGLHGRLDPGGWAAVRTTLDEVRPIAEAATAQAAGRAFWELPDEELSVLGEPGTVGAALREIWLHSQDTGGVDPEFVSAALHHRRPELFPHVDRTTRRQLWPHMVEGDSGMEAVIHRELQANATAFTALEAAVAALLGGDGGTPLTRLRLHDVLLWLSGSLRLTHAVQLGHAAEEWQRYRSGRLPEGVLGPVAVRGAQGADHDGSRPV